MKYDLTDEDFLGKIGHLHDADRSAIARKIANDRIAELRAEHEKWMRNAIDGMNQLTDLNKSLIIEKIKLREGLDIFKDELDNAPVFFMFKEGGGWWASSKRTTKDTHLCKAMRFEEIKEGA